MQILEPIIHKMLIVAIILSFNTLTTIGEVVGNDAVADDWQCYRATGASRTLKCRIPLDRWRSIQREFVQRSLFRSQTVFEPYFFDFATNPIEVRLATDTDNESGPHAVIFNNEPENLRFIYDTLVPKIKHLLGAGSTSTVTTGSSSSGSIGFTGSISGNVVPATNTLGSQSQPSYVHVINNVYGSGPNPFNQTLEPHPNHVTTSSATTTPESIVLTKKPIVPIPNASNSAAETAIEEFVNQLLHSQFASGAQNNGNSANTLPTSIIASVGPGANGGVPVDIFANFINSSNPEHLVLPVKIDGGSAGGNDGNYYASSGNGLAVINIDLGSGGANGWHTKNNGSIVNVSPLHLSNKVTANANTNYEHQPQQQQHQHQQLQEQNKKTALLSVLIQKKIKENQQFIDLIDQIVNSKGN